MNKLILAVTACLVVTGTTLAARMQAPSVRMGAGASGTAVSTSTVTSSGSCHVCRPKSGLVIVFSSGSLIITTNLIGGWGCGGWGYGCGCWGHHHTTGADAATLEALARKHDRKLLGEEAETSVAPPSGPFATALEAMHKGDVTSAKLALADGLASDEAAARGEAMLLLGCAHVQEQNYVEAGRMFEEAYLTHPGLRDEALDGASIFGSKERVIAATQKLTRSAKKSPSRESYFALAVMVHAQGKEKKANQLMDKALSTDRAVVEPAAP